MKRKIILAVLALTLLSAGIFFTLPYFVFGDAIAQMLMGKRYMRSLNENDFSDWIARTEQLLNDNPLPPNEYVEILNEPEIPGELSKLGIMRIDIYESSIDYIWVGGFDHTALYIEKQLDSTFQISAVYDTYTKEVLWPKTTSSLYSTTSGALP